MARLAALTELGTALAPLKLFCLFLDSFIVSSLSELCGMRRLDSESFDLSLSCVLIMLSFLSLLFLGGLINFILSDDLVTDF